MGGRRSREPTDAELLLWRHVVRDVRRREEAAAGAGEQPVAPSPPEPIVAIPPRRAPPVAPRQPPQPLADPGIDRRIWQRLRKGHYPISARLDLHGLSQEAAWNALVPFLAAEQARGSRCVLVITGTGARTGGGILRQLTPRWLESPPNAPRVIAYAPAGPAHGGDGALYVLLRRRRELSG